jgi:hypothetical protein
MPGFGVLRKLSQTPEASGEGLSNSVRTKSALVATLIVFARRSSDEGGLLVYLRIMSSLAPNVSLSGEGLSDSVRTQSANKKKRGMRTLSFF